MKKISRLSASVFASFLAYLSVRPGFVQAMIVSFLVISIGPAEAGDIEMARVIELHLSSASPHIARDDLSAPPSTDNTMTVLSQKRTRSKNAQATQPRLFYTTPRRYGSECSGRGDLANCHARSKNPSCGDGWIVWATHLFRASLSGRCDFFGHDTRRS